MFCTPHSHLAIKAATQECGPPFSARPRGAILPRQVLEELFEDHEGHSFNSEHYENSYHHLKAHDQIEKRIVLFPSFFSHRFPSLQFFPKIFLQDVHGDGGDEQDAGEGRKKFVTCHLFSSVRSPASPESPRRAFR